LAENETVSFSAISVTNSIPEVYSEPSFSKEIQQENLGPESVTKTTVKRLRYQSFGENETVSFSPNSVTDSIPEVYFEPSFSQEY
jgi:hypothetical protein